MPAMPSLFISHGGPNIAIHSSKSHYFLKELPRLLPAAPRAIVIISAHWNTPQLTVGNARQYDTIYDFSGFEPGLYELKYRAAGDDAVAAEVLHHLREFGFDVTVNQERGLDHGAWIPLMLMYPEATIPVIQLSVQPHQHALHHFHIGKALAPLRQENILLIGSGSMTHNLYEAFRGTKQETPPWVGEFTAWIYEQLENGDIERLLNWQTEAPYAKENHPTPEHFLPFFMALGASSLTGFRAMHTDTEYRVLAMDTIAFD